MTLRVKDGGVVDRVLTHPIVISTDYDRVQRSKWPWRSIDLPGYALTPLGILNRICGLTLEVKP